MKLLRTANSLVIIFVLSACIQTKTYTTNQVGLESMGTPMYCGTFSSYVYYTSNDSVLVNDSLTTVANRIYDSIIRRRLRKVEFAKKIDVSEEQIAKELSMNLLTIINYAGKNNKIRNCNITDVFKKITQPFSNNYFIFFVPTGYTRSKQNYYKLKEEREKKQATYAAASVIGTFFAMALTGGVGLVAFVPTGTPVKEQGSNCHLIVYDKKNNEIEFYRQQFFTIEGHPPLERKYIKSQVEYIFKEYL